LTIHSVLRTVSCGEKAAEVLMSFAFFLHVDGKQSKEWNFRRVYRANG
jgi:hypothetical protein